MTTSNRRMAGAAGPVAIVRAIAACGAILGLGMLHAQDASDLDAAAAQRSARISEAVALALADRALEAGALLEASLRNPADSARGQLELGGHLVRLATECAANGKTEAADSYASQALERLASARKLATDRDGGVAASALRLEALVQHEFRGDRDAALAAFRAAAALEPDNAELRTKLERLERQAQTREPGTTEVTP